MINKHILKTPDLDLPDHLLNQVLSEIDLEIAKTSGHDYRSTGDCLTEKILRCIAIGLGHTRAYRLSEQLETTLKHHYQQLVDKISHPCKVRVKSFHRVNWIPIHADRNRTSPQGDTASLSIGIKTNGEQTSFYDWSGSKMFEATVPNLMSCRKVDTITLSTGEAYLFDNSQPHSVTGFRFNQPRHLLVLSWPGLEFQELKQIYQETYCA